MLNPDVLPSGENLTRRSYLSFPAYALSKVIGTRLSWLKLNFSLYIKSPRTSPIYPFLTIYSKLEISRTSLVV